jgi:hypothetical protein
MDRNQLIEHLKNENIQLEMVSDPKLKVQLLGAMLQFIGDPDPDLRDELICNTFYEWANHRDVLDHETLKWLLDELLNEEHLFKGIGESGTDNVYARSFSVLIIGQILVQHSEDPFLSTEKMTAVLDQLLTYYTSERDYRGFTTPQGWAHAAAHGADAFDAFIQCPECDEIKVVAILDTISKMLNNEMWVFQHEEDERMTRVVYRAILSGKLSIKALIPWLEQLSDNNAGVSDMAAYTNRINSKHFVRSLYFKVLILGGSKELLEVLTKAESNLNRYGRMDHAMVVATE